MSFFQVVLIFVAGLNQATQEKSWVGNTVIAKAPGVNLTERSGKSVQSDSSRVINVDFQVEQEVGGLIKVKNRYGYSGWVLKSDVVLLQDALAAR